MYKQSKSEVEWLEEEVYNALLESIDLAKWFVDDKIPNIEFKIDFGEISVWLNVLSVTMGDNQRLLIWEPLKERRIVMHYEEGTSDFNFDTYAEPYLRASVRIFVKYHLDMAYYTLRLPGVLKQILETYDQKR